MKRFLSMLLVAVMVLSLVTSASALTLRPGKTYSSYVLALQVCLNNKGYYVTEDGKYGDATKAAVIAFQAANGLKIDGIAGPATLAALGYTYGGNSGGYIGATLRKGSSGSAVISLQQGLRALNYPVGNIDGKYGSGTQAAVRLFQQYNGLKVDGVAGSTTLSVLYGGNAVPYGGHVNPQPSGTALTNVAISSNTPVVGIAVSAQASPDVSANYVWYREGGMQVGTGRIYTPTNSDIGYRLYVTATNSKNSVSSIYTSAVTLSSEAKAKYLLAGTVTIPTSAGVGDVLNAGLGLHVEHNNGITHSSCDSSHLNYAWYVNGVIRGTGKTFTVPTGTVGNAVRLVVTHMETIGDDGKTVQVENEVGSNYCTINNSNGSNGNYDKVVTPLKGNVSLTGAVNNTVAPGTSLGVTGTLNTDPVIGMDILTKGLEYLDYKWYKRNPANGSQYANGTGLTYYVSTEDVGYEIYCLISAKANTSYTGSVQTGRVTVTTTAHNTENGQLTGTMSIPASVVVGDPIAITKSLAPATAALTYKWEVNKGAGWQDTGVTTVSLPTTGMTAGWTVRVTITASGDGYGSMTSNVCTLNNPVIAP